MRRALIVGGTGQIGRAVAARLLAGGWEVTVAARTGHCAPPGATLRRLDRSEPGALAAAVGAGVDLVVDAVAYDDVHGRQLLALAGRVGAVVAISSASVYADGAGRSLDEAGSDDELPVLPLPIPEDHPTVQPGRDTYSTRKMALERTLLEQDELRTVVLRPCAIHGPGSRAYREWWWVQRLRDRRPAVPLAHAGESRFHTTATANIAQLVALAAESEVTGVFNCGDPDPPTVAQIGLLLGAAMSRSPEHVLLPGSPPSPGVGDNPWGLPADRPFLVDMRRGVEELAYDPVTSYADRAEETCRWLLDAVGDRDWREVLPGLAAYAEPMFDYAAEDAFLRSRS